MQRRLIRQFAACALAAGAALWAQEPRTEITRWQDGNRHASR